AIKLYDKQDWMSAHIELTKVLDGSSGDDAENKQRAEFFVAKTMYQMGFYVASQAMLDKIANAGAAHRYYTATIKWYAAIGRVVPQVPQALTKFTDAEIAD